LERTLINFHDFKEEATLKSQHYESVIKNLQQQITAAQKNNNNKEVIDREKKRPNDVKVKTVNRPPVKPRTRSPTILPSRISVVASRTRSKKAQAK